MGRLSYTSFTVVLLIVGVAFGADKTPISAAPGPTRFEQLVEANIVGIHAYQILLARKQGNTDPRAGRHPSRTTPLLKHWLHIKLHFLQRPRRQSDGRSERVRRLILPKIYSRSSAPTYPMPVNLPVNLFTAYLREKAPHHRAEEIRSSGKSLPDGARSRTRW